MSARWAARSPSAAARCVPDIMHAAPMPRTARRRSQSVIVLLLSGRPDVWRHRRAQVRVEYTALTHRGVERAHVPPGRSDVLDHTRAHRLDIAATRGGQQAPMRG